MAALDLHLLADLLAIGHPGLGEVGVHAEAALQPGENHVHLHVAGTGDHHLAGLGVVDPVKGQILLVQTGEAGGDLVLLALGLGGDGHRVAGLREGDGGHFDHFAGIADGVARLEGVHLADGADVAADQLLDFLGLLALHDIQPSQLHRLPGTGVHQSHVGGQGAREHLHIGVLAVLVGGGLKDEGAGIGPLGEDVLLRLAVGVLHLYRGTLQGVGDQVHDGVQQHQGAQALHGRAAEHREQGELPHTLAQALDHLGIGKVLAGEIFIHELLAGLGHALLQRVVELVQHRNLILGYGDLHPLAVLEFIGPLVEHVDDADDLFMLVPDGGHHGGDVLAEALPQGGEGGVIVGVVLVGLGDIEDAGEFPLLAVVPGLFGAHAHAGLGRADDDGGVGDADGLPHLAGKVEIAGGVQHVDLTATVLHRRHGQGDGDLAPDLLGIVVTNGIAVHGRTHTDGAAGQIQHALCQGGLSVAAMSQQADIADVLRGIAHLFPLLT